MSDIIEINMTLPLRSPEDPEAPLFSDEDSEIFGGKSAEPPRDRFARWACSLLGLACLVGAGFYLHGHRNTDWLPAANPARPVLRFPETGLLKIGIFADLHWGEAPDSWGPAQDINSTRVISHVLDVEKPDMVVFSGDQLTGEFMSLNGTEHFRRIADPLVKRNIPWASTYGNHDQGRRLNESGGSGLPFDPAFPLALVRVEQTFDLSHTKRGPPNLFGTTNYVLPVFSSSGKTAKLYLWFLDSGLENVVPAQVAWVRSTYAALPKDAAATHLLFMHIPTKQVEELQASPLFQPPSSDLPATCTGLTDEPHPGVQPDDHGLFRALAGLKFSSIYSGHDHGTTWCCTDPTSDVELCMGRRSGYGGYGVWDRGARVLLLNETAMVEAAEQGRKYRATTWVRMENGTILKQ